MDTAAQALLAYAVVALTPGPNMLLVASTAALRGFRAAVPHSFGTAAAVGAIALAAHLAAEALLGSRPAMNALSIASGILLLFAAIRMATVFPASPDCQQAGAVGFAAGFRVAIVNPVTVAYFAGAFAGPLSGQTLAAGLVVAGASTLSLGIGLGVAATLGRPAIRRAVLPRQRQFRFITATLLALAAGSVLIQSMSGIAVAAVP